MRFVKLMLKIWPELMVLLSSISYTIIRLVADVNKLPYLHGLMILIYQQFHCF